jgi:hypothetical protein
VMALYLGDASPLQPAQAMQPRQTVAWQFHQVRRPAPYVTRGANGRLLVTTSLSGLH